MLNAIQVIEMNSFSDSRGRFVKPFQQSAFSKWGAGLQFKEDFYSISKAGALRGMHFQIPPFEHAKFVYCSRGRVLDVCLDLRVGSKTEGQSFSWELSASNGRGLLIPAGFAHGFLSLEDESTMHYKTTCEYQSTHDTGVLWNSFGFDWVKAANELGVNLKESDLKLSDRDLQFIQFQKFNSPFSAKPASENQRL